MEIPMRGVVVALDRVAGQLECMGHSHLAYTLDVVANSFESEMDREAGALSKIFGLIALAITTVFSSPMKTQEFMEKFKPADVAAYIVTKVQKGATADAALSMLDRFKDAPGGHQYIGGVLHSLDSIRGEWAGELAKGVREGESRPAVGKVERVQEDAGSALTTTLRRLTTAPDGKLWYEFKTTLKSDYGPSSRQDLKKEVDRMVRGTLDPQRMDGEHIEAPKTTEEWVAKCVNSVEPDQATVVYRVPYYIP